MKSSQFNMSSEQVKDIATALYPFISEYIQEHQQEYEEFLKAEYPDFKRDSEFNNDFDI